MKEVNPVGDKPNKVETVDDRQKLETWLSAQLKHATREGVTKPRNIVRDTIPLPDGTEQDIWLHRRSWLRAYPSIRPHVFDLLAIALEIFTLHELRFRSSDAWINWASRYGAVAWRNKNHSDPQMKILLAFCRHLKFAKIIKEINTSSDKKDLDWVQDILDYWDKGTDYISQPQSDKELGEIVKTKERSFRNVGVGFVIPSLIDALVQNNLEQFFPKVKPYYQKDDLLEELIKRYAGLLTKQGPSPQTYANRCYQCLVKETKKKSREQAAQQDAQLRNRFIASWQAHDQAQGTAPISQVVTLDNTIILMREFGVGPKGVGQRREDTIYAGHLMHTTLEEQEELYTKIKEYALETYGVNLDEGYKETILDRKKEEVEEIKKSKAKVSELTQIQQQIDLIRSETTEKAETLVKIQQSLKSISKEQQHLRQILKDQREDLETLVDDVPALDEQIRELQEQVSSHSDALEAQEKFNEEFQGFTNEQFKVMRRNEWIWRIIVILILLVILWQLLTIGA